MPRRHPRSAAPFMLAVLALVAGARAQVITDFQRTGTAVLPGWRFGEPGDQISLTGSGFNGISHVGFDNGVGGRIQVPATNAADTQINNVTVPLGVGTGLISVRKSGVDFFGAKIFTAIGPEPYITSLSTNVGAIGTPITVEGDNFVDGGGNPVITAMSFNGTPAASTPNGLTARIVTIPAGTTGPISATSPAGTRDSGTNFFYFPPVLAGFTPANAPPGTLITLQGQSLRGLTAVLFASGQSAAFTVLSNTAATATVPAGARTGKIFISGPAGSAQSTNEFQVPPTLGGFTPSNGIVGTVVNIRGTNLFNVSSVTFAGVTATGLVTNNAGTNVTATVPNGATTGFIAVTTPAGSVTSAVPFYLPPQLNNPAFTPDQGRAGTNVVITGLNLSNATAVTFSGAGAVFSNLSPTSLRAVVPGGVFSGAVSVTTPGGQATSATLFRIQPLLTGFSPASGYPGDTFTVTGTNFAPDSVVLLSLSNAPVLAVTPTSITAVVPTNVSSGPIRVGNFGGTDQSTNVFTVLAPQIELEILATNGAVVVSWPTTPGGFRLQTAPSLSAPIFWTNVSGATSIFEGRFTVTNPTPTTNGFFRLIFP